MRRGYRLRAFSLGLIALLLFPIGSLTASSQILERFGEIGAMRRLKGQVRAGNDSPIPLARLEVTNLANDQSYSIEGDENGIFQKHDLPSGDYKVSISASGFNMGEYTLRIDAKQGSKKYTVVRLSLGCAPGDSGIALVKRLDQPSFRKD